MLRNAVKTFLLFLMFWFVSCTNHTKKATSRLVIENRSITKEVKVDSSAVVSQMIAKYKESLQAKMGEVVGYSKMYLPKGKPESLLSNMVADFTYELGKRYCKENNLSHSVDAAIINIGGLRKAMPQGNITLGDIYEISPFENKLLIVALKGKDLRELFQHIVHKGGEGVGNIRLKASKEDQKLIAATVNAKPLKDDKLYYIISIDYLINGGDGMSAFGKKVAMIDMNLKSRDALFAYVKEEYKAKRPLQSKLDNRISYE